MNKTVAVIGAGSWGTALAHLVGRKGFPVVMWAWEREVADGINITHKNPLYLNDVRLPDKVRATCEIGEALSRSKIILSAVPSQALRLVWNKAKPHIEGGSVVVSCTKGIEAGSLKFMSEVLSECISRKDVDVTVLSGPSFAYEVAMGLPTSVVIAGRNKNISERIQELLRTDVFLTFTNEDVIGVEVGGAVKNVIAIATGVSDGLNLGHNSRAAIITRGLYEMIKIGKALGANPLTFAGLSGIGDLVLTCTADLSRNHTLGKQLGLGHKLPDILKNMKMVAEGVETARALRKLTSERRINAPICDIMYRILHEELAPSQAVKELCGSVLKEELGALL